MFQGIFKLCGGGGGVDTDPQGTSHELEQTTLRLKT